MTTQRTAFSSSSGNLGISIVNFINNALYSVDQIRKSSLPYKDLLETIVTSESSQITPFQDITDERFLSVAQEFIITQLDEESKPSKSFHFTLLPAIESKVGGTQVPEVKPGILKRCAQSIKTFNIPGGVPVFQVLGIEPTMLQLVGLITGSEFIKDTNSTGITPTNSKGVTAIYNPSSKLNALWYAEYFEKHLLQEGRPLLLKIVAGEAGSNTPAPITTDIRGEPRSTNQTPFNNNIMTVEHKILLQNVRYFITRQDRVYYSFDALVLDYPSVKTSSSVTDLSTKTPSNPIEIKIDETPEL